jgi:hypothetical protein
MQDPVERHPTLADYPERHPLPTLADFAPPWHSEIKRRFLHNHCRTDTLGSGVWGAKDIIARGSEEERADLLQKIEERLAWNHEIVSQDLRNVRRLRMSVEEIEERDVNFRLLMRGRMGHLSNGGRRTGLRRLPGRYQGPASIPQP